MVCFSKAVLVKGLQIDDVPDFPIRFLHYNHTVTPCYGFSNRDWFNNAQLDITVLSSLNLLLPM